MSEKKKSIKINAALSTLQTIMKIVFPLISFPYASRILGVELIGKYNFSNSVVSYFMLIAGLGISTYAIREGTKYRDDRIELENFAKEIFSINVISMMLAYALLFMAVLFIPMLKNYIELIGIISLSILFTTLGRGWLYTIYEDYYFITIRTIAIQFSSLILLFVWVRNSEDILPYTILTTFALVGNELLNLLFSQKYCHIKFSYRINKDYIKPILLIFSTAVSITIYQSSDTTMLGLFGTDYNVGLYGVSVKIYNIVKQMVAALLIVTIPRLSYYIGQKKFSEYQILFTKVINILMLILLPATVGLLMVSKECIMIISGEKFVDATFSLQLLSIALIFNLLSYMLGYCVLLPNNKEKQFFNATLFGAIINIVLNFIMIPIFMQNGAAFTTVVAECSAAFICLKNSREIISFKGIMKNIVSSLLGCIWIVVACIAIKSISNNYIITLVLSIVISGLGYILIQFLLKNQLCIKFFSEILKKRIRK